MTDKPDVSFDWLYASTEFREVLAASKGFVRRTYQLRPTRAGAEIWIQEHAMDKSMSSARKSSPTNRARRRGSIARLPSSKPMAGWMRRSKTPSVVQTSAQQ
jgi:hypothetical protein